jgi:quinol-cytochrome oxidoreductase complex cytochrome b subunit
MTMQTKPSLLGWLDDRVGWSRGRGALAERRLPRGRIDYDIGSAVVFLIVVQVVSGVLLLMHYRADADHARESVAAIETLLPFGSLIRGVHAWGADLLVLAAAAYVFALLLQRSYRAPRELVWVAAVATFLVVLMMSFTGSVLPWSQEVHAQTQVATSLAEHVPLVGAWLKAFLLGGHYTSSMTLGRAFGFHVAVFPAVTTALVLAHVGLLSGDAQPRESETSDAATIAAYPDLVVRHATLWVLLLAVLVTLATFFPHDVGAALDLAKPSPEGVRPAWYFLWVYALLRLAPAEMLGVAGTRFIVVVGTLLLLALPWLPFVDRRGSRVTPVLAVSALVGIVGLTVYALV